MTTLFDPHVNGAYSTLLNAPGVAGLIATVKDPTKFVAGANATIRAVGTVLPFEIVRITSITNRDLAITRCAETNGASAVALNVQASWEIFQGETVKTVTDIENAVNTIESSYFSKAGGTLTGNLVVTPSEDGTSVVNVTNNAGTSVLNVDTTNQRIGIGTESPSNTLHVKGDGTILLEATNTALTFKRPGGGSVSLTSDGGIFQFNAARVVIPSGDKLEFNLVSLTQGDLRVRSGDNSTVNLFIQSASKGGVGIGTALPSAQLEVDTPSATTKGLIVKGFASQSAKLQEWQDSSGNVLFSVAPNGVLTFSSAIRSTASIQWDDSNSSIQSPNSSSMIFQLFNSSRFTFKDAQTGKTISITPASGIMSAPNFSGSVNGSSTYYTAWDGASGSAGTDIIVRGGNSGTDPQFAGGSAGNVQIYPGKQTDSTLGHEGTRGYIALSTYTSGITPTLTERVRITPDGNVGIGTANPLAPLHVQGDGVSWEGLRLLNTNSDSGVTTQAAIQLGITNSAGQFFAKVAAVESSFDDFVDLAFSVVTSSSSGQVEAMRLTKIGSLEIGTHSNLSAPKITVKQSGGNFTNLLVGTALSVLQFYSGKNFGITAASTIGDNGASNYSQIAFGATRNTAFGDMLSTQVDPGARVAILQTSPTSEVLIVRGAASQSANLQEWQDSSGNVLVSIDPTGVLNTAVVGTNVATFHSTTFQTPSITIQGSDRTAKIAPPSSALVGTGIQSQGFQVNGRDNSGVLFDNANTTIHYGFLFGEGAGSLGLRNVTSATSPQQFNIYNAYTNLTTYERAELNWNANANVFTIQTAASGVGSLVRNIALMGGNVGIGTTTPDYPLSVKATVSSGSAIDIIGSSGTTFFQAGGVFGGSILSGNNSSTQGFVIGTSGGATSTPTGQYLRFRTSGVDRLVVDNNGLVGINQSSSGAQLEIDASSATTKGLIVKGFASQSANLQEIQSSDGTVLFSIDPTGQVVFNLQNDTTIREILFNASNPMSGTLNKFGLQYWNTNQANFGIFDGGAYINFQYGGAGATLKGQWNFPSNGCFGSPVNLLAQNTSGNVVQLNLTKSGDGSGQSITATAYAYSSGAGTISPTFSLYAQSLTFGTFDQSAGWSAQTKTNVMTISPGGLVGINQTSPTYGFHQLGGQSRVEALSTPPQPNVNINGPTGATTYSYYIVAIDQIGNQTIPSTTRTITTGNATLDGSNYNVITWTVVNGARQYQVIRSAGGASQGLIGTVTGLRLNDTGLVASAYTPATRNATADTIFDGNVGIGTPTPSYTLDVNGKSRIDGITIEDNVSDQRITFNNTHYNFLTNTPSGVWLAYKSGVGIANGQFDPGGSLQINTQSATTKGVIVKGFASQSANLQEWQDSSGNVLARVDQYGFGYFSAIRSYPWGDKNGNNWGLANPGSTLSTTFDFQRSVTIPAGAKLGVGTVNPILSGSGNLHMNADRFRVDTPYTPTTSSDPGNPGEIAWDADFVYVCTAANTWKRTALTTF